MKDIESFLFFFFLIAEGVARQIGLFHPDMGLELNGSWPVLWPLGQPPVATRIIKVLLLLLWSSGLFCILLYVLRVHIFFQYRIETVAPTAFYTMTLLASLGIVFALICLSFNLVKRKLKYIKKDDIINIGRTSSCLTSRCGPS